MIIDRVTLWRRFHLLLLYNHLDLFCATSRFRLYLLVSTTIFFKLIHQLNTCLRYLNHSICTLLFPSFFFWSCSLSRAMGLPAMAANEGIQLCVFDSRRGHQEGQELDKILFFFPSDFPYSVQLSVVGLSEGLITFTRFVRQVFG